MSFANRNQAFVSEGVLLQRIREDARWKRLPVEDIRFRERQSYEGDLEWEVVIVLRDAPRSSTYDRALWSELLALSHMIINYFDSEESGHEPRFALILFAHADEVVRLYEAPVTMPS